MHALATLRRLNDRAFVRSAVAARYALPDHHPHDDEIVAEALRILQARHAVGETLGSPRDAVAYLRLALAPVEREIFGVIYLDNLHRVLAFDQPFAGTIDYCAVHAREIVRAALHYNAAAVVLAHGHPSGDPDPSPADERLTHQLRDALALVGVRVLDHIVVGAEGHVSLAERGLLR